MTFEQNLLFLYYFWRAGLSILATDHPPKGIFEANVAFVTFFNNLCISYLGSKFRKNKALQTLDVKRWAKKPENSSDDEAQDIFEEQGYVSVLGTDPQGISDTNAVFAPL